MVAHGGAVRPAVVDTTVASQAVDVLAQTSDRAQRAGQASATFDGIVITAANGGVVNHGLGTANIYWHIKRMQSLTGSYVWQSSCDDRVLDLRTNADCTVSIEVSRA